MMKTTDKPLERDPVLRSLKDSYFKMLPREVIGATPELTKDIDSLELAIREQLENVTKAV